MPRSLHAWYGVYDLETLGDRGAVVDGELRVAELTRLGAALHAEQDRAVRVTLRFGRTAAGQVWLQLAFAATLQLTCQRCLEPVEHTVDESIEWVLVGSDAEASAVTGEGEALVLVEDRLQPAALVEDELIVSLPMVARHATIDECGALAQNFDGILVEQDAERDGPMLEA